MSKLDFEIDRTVREMLDVEPPAGLRDRVIERISEVPGASAFPNRVASAFPKLVASAFRRKIHQRIHHATGARKSSAFVGFENVAIPSRIAAARSLRGVNNHRVPRGARSGDATSL
jgi:hypothetical protein